MFFLYLQLLSPAIAVVAVLVSTGVAIVAVGRLSGFSVGGVLGPMIGAGVAVAIRFGYRALSREAEERQRLITELVDTRRIIAEPTPPALDDRTLPGALRRLAASTEHTLRAEGTSTSVHFQLAGDPVPLPMSVDATKLQVSSRTAPVASARDRGYIRPA